MMEGNRTSDVNFSLPEMMTNVTDSILDVRSSETTPKPNYTISDEIWAARVGIYGVGGTVIAVFGLLGNIISIIVLSKYKQKSSAPLLLIILALFDIAFLSSELILETLATISNGNLIARSYLTWLTPGYVIFFPAPFVAQTGTTFMTVIITIERYIAVVQPFLASRVCKRSIALKASGVVLVWSVVYHVPRYMAYTYYDQWQEDTNSTKIIFNRTLFGNGNFYNWIYIVWINLTVEFLVPCSILVVLNILMLRALRKSKTMAEKNSMTKSRKEGQRLTAMVLAVTTMFFFCELFPAISLIRVRGLNRYNECSLACNNFMSVADTMIILNSACNFILYCVVGKRFRQIFRQTFCPLPARWRFRSQSSNIAGNVNTFTTSQGHTKTRM